MIKVQFRGDDPAGVAGAEGRPLGPASRQSELGFYRDSEMIVQGQIDMTNVVQTGRHGAAGESLSHHAARDRPLHGVGLAAAGGAVGARRRNTIR